MFFKLLYYVLSVAHSTTEPTLIVEKASLINFCGVSLEDNKRNKQEQLNTVVKMKSVWIIFYFVCM